MSDTTIAVKDIQCDMTWLFQHVDRNIGTADDDWIMQMIAYVSSLGCYVNQIAMRTDEWWEWEVCEGYDEDLVNLYEALTIHLYGEN